MDFLKKITGDDKVDDREEIGIGGFTAMVRVSESVQFTSDVPDNYVEDGSVIHDHVINNPIILTIEGEVADIHIKPEFITDTIFAPVDKAASIANNVYPTRKTQQMLQRMNKVATDVTDAYNKVEDVLQRGKNLYSMFGDDVDDSPQKNFFDFIDYVYYTKMLINIEMAFRIYTNMRITSLTVIRDNTTEQALKYKLSAKEVRFAETVLVDKNKYFKKPSQSVKGKVKDKKNKGAVEPKKSTLKVITELF